MPVECIPLPDNINYDQQAVVVPGTQRPGQTGTPSSSVLIVGFLNDAFSKQVTIGTASSSSQLEYPFLFYFSSLWLG